MHTLNRWQIHGNYGKKQIFLSVKFICAKRHIKLGIPQESITVKQQQVRAIVKTAPSTPVDSSATSTPRADLVANPIILGDTRQPLSTGHRRVRVTTNITTTVTPATIASCVRVFGPQRPCRVPDPPCGAGRSLGGVGGRLTGMAGKRRHRGRQQRVRGDQGTHRLGSTTDTYHPPRSPRGRRSPDR